MDPVNPSRGRPYIRNLALLVICYGMSINIVEVTNAPSIRKGARISDN